MFLASAALWLTFAAPAYADWTQKFARISCIPELGVLHIEHVEMDGIFFPDGYTGDAKSDAGLKLWRKHGFYEEGRLDFVCKLPGATYRFKSRIAPASERGYCGAAPPAYIDFWIGGKPFLQAVTFGDECSAAPSVRSITVFDRKREGDTPAITVCIAPSEYQTPHNRFCEYRAGAEIMGSGAIDYLKMRTIYEKAHPNK